MLAFLSPISQQLESCWGGKQPVLTGQNLKNVLSYNYMFSRVKVLVAGLLLSLLLTPLQSVYAAVPSVGIHILRPAELSAAKQLVSLEPTNAEAWQYVTIPFSLDDLERTTEWREFFVQAREYRIIPVVRLVTRFADGVWQVPSRKDVVLQLDALNQMPWPTPDRYIVIGNEVNHAAEWGGTINPAEYARVLVFASNWARTQQHPFTVLPAAMDLAAPNGSTTKEAFAYLDAMRAAEPDVLAAVDVWNSHSYPNPGFSASPQRTGKNSLRGFEHELAYLKQHTGKDFTVIITETGWQDNASTGRWLSAYYEYALRHVWSHPQVIAVTPFVLQGAPGPFAGFSFLDASQQPTRQYVAFQQALQKLVAEHHLLTSVIAR